MYHHIYIFKNTGSMSKIHDVFINYWCLITPYGDRGLRQHWLRQIIWHSPRSIFLGRPQGVLPQDPEKSRSYGVGSLKRLIALKLDRRFRNQWRFYSIILMCIAKPHRVNLFFLRRHLPESRGCNMLIIHTVGHLGCEITSLGYQATMQVCY